jgi:hypothetical protein
MKTIASPVKFTAANNNTFLIGRTLVNGVYTIGKVHFGPTLFAMYFWDPNIVAEQSKTTGYEVLACV